MTRQTVPMREGFTTGSAATGAAMAAASRLLGGDILSSIFIPLPPVPEYGGMPDSSECARLHIPLACCRRESIISCRAGVIKDGGDDPDATDGAFIEAVVSLERVDTMGDDPIMLAGNIFLYGGPGIGRVTLPGLPVAVGEPAINPEPRRQIAAGLIECAARFGHTGPLHCMVRVPEGEKRAKATMNERLGILGGISILGTRGTVKPYSHDAWRSAISQGMDVAAALGCNTVCLSTGRRSEKALRRLFPALPDQAFIQAADYAQFSLEETARHKFSRVIWGCFPGKLLKLAQGLGWTHAREAAPDVFLLTSLVGEAGAPKELATEAAAMPTVLGALGLLREYAPHVEQTVLNHMAAMALNSMRGMLASTDSATPPRLSLRVFSMDGALLVCLD